jgi:hypothetical protein
MNPPPTSAPVDVGAARVHEGPVHAEHPSLPVRLREAVHAWVREDLDTGAKMLIGFHGPKLIARLEAVASLAIKGTSE